MLVHGLCEKILFSLFFLFKQNKPNKSLGDVLDRELPFLDSKKIDVKTRKNLYFSRGDSPWFSFHFVLSQNKKTKSFNDVLDIKLSFLD